MYYDQKKIAHLCPGKKQLAAMEEAVQYMSERRKRRFANFKLQVEKYWRLYPWLRQSTPTAKNDQRSLGGGGSSSSHHSIAALGALLFVVCVVLMSCRSQQIIVPNDTVTNTKTQTKTIQRDSVYHYDKDSMSVSLRSGAHVGSDPTCYPYGRTIGGQTLMCYPARVDTLVIEKWHEHWKDRWLTRIDTLTQRDTTLVTQTITQTITEQVKVVPGFYKWCTELFWLLIAGVIVIIVLKIWIK